MHKVIDGDADLTVSDLGAWNYFQKLYPGPSQNLKVLCQSEVFPATVIAYKKNALTEETVKKLRTGLLAAHESAKGGALMRTIKMDKFEALPASYDDSLKAIQKAYPRTKAVERVVAEK
jgi:ABC-type phosphate/phosphonate transport system substrate-binding protein